ncbi:hypothetical protein C0J52_04361 [Blattella germanica]|nr:hypothetical protein C0J52_04361 [Blattella germanica]
MFRIFCTCWQHCLPCSTHFGLSATRIFGPFFFEGNVNGHSYQEMLNGAATARKWHRRHCCLNLMEHQRTSRITYAITWPMVWKRFCIFTSSLCLTSKKSRSDDTRQCSLGFHKGISKKHSISLNAGIMSSCGIRLHPRDSGVSPQNICENIVQNFDVLRHGWCSYRFFFLLRLQVDSLSEANTTFYFGLEMFTPSYAVLLQRTSQVLVQLLHHHPGLQP